jgi:hypothetical protein
MSALNRKLLAGLALIAAGWLSPQASQAAPWWDVEAALKPTLNEPFQLKSAQPVSSGSLQTGESLIRDPQLKKVPSPQVTEVWAQGFSPWESGTLLTRLSLSQNTDAGENAVILQVEGVLERGDPTLPDGSWYDSYKFEGQAGDLIQIWLESDAFDPYLILLDPEGEQIAVNDDTIGSANSAIVIALPQTGTYQIFAEVLGLGFQLQRVGAKAVMASLWQVSDRGTQVLMSAFYAALGQGMTKAEALRAAQLVLINSSETLGAAGDGPLGPVFDHRGIGVVGNGPNAGGTARSTSYSHPYYWAPFILIGNGL